MEMTVSLKKSKRKFSPDIKETGDKYGKKNIFQHSNGRPTK
jgi:hypothetical protein